MSVASASLPVIGKRLEPLGAATAMGIWGYRHVPGFRVSTARAWLSTGHGDDSQAGPRCDERRHRGRAARHRARRGSRDRVACARADPAGVEDAAAPAQRAPGLGALRRPPVTVAGRVAPQGTARRTGAGDDLRSRRRLDPRRPAAAGLRADVASGRAGLGVSVGRTTGCRRTTAGRSTSPTSRPRSRGRAPTSTGSAATAISLR